MPLIRASMVIDQRGSIWETPTVTRPGPHPEQFTCWTLDEGTVTTYADVLGLTRRRDEIRTWYLKAAKQASYHHDTTTGDIKCLFNLINRIKY